MKSVRYIIKHWRASSVQWLQMSMQISINVLHFRNTQFRVKIMLNTQNLKELNEKALIQLLTFLFNIETTKINEIINWLIFIEIS